MMFDLRNPLHVLRLPIGREQPIRARRLPVMYEFISDPGGNTAARRRDLSETGRLPSRDRGRDSSRSLTISFQ
jgi:hypothetical protein